MQIENTMLSGVGLPADPQQDIVVFNCNFCNGEIFEGDLYVVYEELIFCSSDHLGDHLVKHDIAEELIANDENIQ